MRTLDGSGRLSDLRLLRKLCAMLWQYLGCAICIEVCPWSEPGRGPSLSDRVLALRSPSERNRGG